MWKIKMYDGYKIEFSTKCNGKNIILFYEFSSLEYFTDVL